MANVSQQGRGKKVVCPKSLKRGGVGSGVANISQLDRSKKSSMPKVPL